ncbi:hypothetical protein YC2023_031366 [Brassica napus]
MPHIVTADLKLLIQTDLLDLSGSLTSDHSRLPMMRLIDTKVNIPECSLPQLKTFEWRGYEEPPENRKLASYILTNASGLKWALISSGLYMRIRRKNGFSRTLCVRKEFPLLSSNSNTRCHVSFY